LNNNSPNIVVNVCKCYSTKLKVKSDFYWKNKGSSYNVVEKKLKKFINKNYPNARFIPFNEISFITIKKLKDVFGNYNYNAWVDMSSKKVSVTWHINISSIEFGKGIIECQLRKKYLLDYLKLMGDFSNEEQKVTTKPRNIVEELGLSDTPRVISPESIKW
jgi:hypothetical protein